MKSFPSVRFLLPLFLLALLPQAIWAHPGHESAIGFTHGFTHPLSGLDHLLAMIAVGLWAAQLGGRAVWMVPFSFVGAMILGGFAGIAGFNLPYLEQGIALSVLLLGLFVALAFRLPLAVPAALVALFAVFHGVAHGHEMPAAASGLLYSAGFVLATALLHLAGIGLGLGFQRISSPALVRWTGGVTAVLGLYLLVG